jgi:hypothetical protein
VKEVVTMGLWISRCALFFVGLAVLGQAPGRAQSLHWDPRFAAPGGTNGRVEACAVFDDGSGPALFIGGSFTQAGNVYTVNVAKLGPQGWEPVGEGVGVPGQTVTSLKVFDDGSGPKLYAAGNISPPPGSYFSKVMCWDGSQWTVVGSACPTGRFILEVYDDGSGPALYAGGSSINMGTMFSSIARWNGSTWTPLPGLPINIAVSSMLTWNDGTGSKLHVGFGQNVGPAPITRWDGSTWSPMAGSLGPVVSMCVFDDGTGPTLYEGGNFTGCVMRWNGSTWTQVGSGLLVMQYVHLATFDDGSGAALYVGNGPRLKRLVSGSWSQVGGVFDNWISSLFAGDAGYGPRLFVGGLFTRYGSSFVSQFCEWDGSSIHTPGPAPGWGVQGSVEGFVARTEAGIPTLYAGGQFSVIGGQSCSGLGRYQQGQWTVLPPGGSSGEAMLFFDEGSGPVLMAAGDGGLARWDGSAWSQVGSGVNGVGHALAEYDPGTGPALYVGGEFAVAGGILSPNIASWSGTNWSAAGIGVDGQVYALAVYDYGTGPRLYVTGTFVNAGGVPASRIASWDGTSWHTLGSGLDNHGFALKVFDDGSGPELYVGGFFTHAGGQTVNGIAKWNGTTFAPVGSGFAGSGFTPGVRALAAFDDGAGPALYAGGQFTSAGGHPASGLARWNGSTWSALGGGTDGFVNALLPFDDSSAGGSVLMVGGMFGHAGLLDSTSIAEWHAGLATVSAFCVGDGSAGRCPCYNAGQPGRGCENSYWTGGAQLSASGSPVPDTLVLQAAGMLPSVSALAIQGDALLYEPVFYGDGLRCAGGHLRRLYVGQAVGGALAVPGPSDPSISQRSAALGDPLLPGSVRTYQVVYRDTDPAFCAQGGTLNITNALRVVW